MRTIEDLFGVRQELMDILRSCDVPSPEPLWQLSDWCITMQSIIDIDFRLLALVHGTPEPGGS